MAMLGRHGGPLQAKENRTGPSGAGDQPGDFGEARVAFILITKSALYGGDLVCASLPAADEPGAGLNARCIQQHRCVAGFNVLREPKQLPTYGAAQTAMGILLQAISQTAGDQILLGVKGQGTTKDFLPQYAQLAGI